MRNVHDVPRGLWRVEDNPFLMLFLPLYHWWEDHTQSEKTTLLGYNENLCHYMRVVFFWAPLEWFFVAPINYRRSWRWLKRWMIAAFLISATVFGYTFWRWPSQSLQVLIAVVVTIVALVLVGLLAGGLAALGEWVWERIRPGVRWFFLSRRWYIVSPWLVTLVALFVISVLVLGWEKTTWIMEAIIYVALVVGFWIAVMVGIPAGISALRRRNRRKRLQRSGGYTSATQHSVPRPQRLSTMRVAASTVWAQHNRFCPLLEMPKREHDI